MCETHKLQRINNVSEMQNVHVTQSFLWLQGNKMIIPSYFMNFINGNKSDTWRFWLTLKEMAQLFPHIPYNMYFQIYVNDVRK